MRLSMSGQSLFLHGFTASELIIDPGVLTNLQMWIQASRLWFHHSVTFFCVL